MTWIDGKTEGGYLLLLGPPGQGKSALVAELARRESTAERGGCLLHMVKSHNNPAHVGQVVADRTPNSACTNAAIARLTL